MGTPSRFSFDLLSSGSEQSVERADPVEGPAGGDLERIASVDLADLRPLLEHDRTDVVPGQCDGHRRAGDPSSNDHSIELFQPTLPI